MTHIFPGEWKVIMSSRILPRIVSAGFAIATAILLYGFASLTAARTFAGPSPQTPQLDYEFFKARVEPIFLKVRSADHARCYVCHQIMRHGGGPLSLSMLPSGMTFWTEEQSRHNFQVVSKLVVPGDPDSSLFLQMPLAPEAGGLADTHQGGRQFASQDDPDWKNMKAWVLGQKLDSPAKAQ
jgi:hypothetical protein